MFDKGPVIIGILIFLILVTSPIWTNLAGGTSATLPEIEIATKNVPGKDKCVEDAKYMRPFHMDLLNDWREEVVREGERVHTSPDGRKFDKSLTNTCLNCHTSKEKFCDRCHNYLNVKPYCWTCHIVPEEVK